MPIFNIIRMNKPNISIHINENATLGEFRYIMQHGYHLDKHSMIVGEQFCLYLNDADYITIKDFILLYTPELIGVDSISSSLLWNGRDRSGVRFLRHSDIVLLEEQEDLNPALLCPINSELIRSPVEINGRFFEAKPISFFLRQEVIRWIDTNCKYQPTDPFRQELSREFFLGIIDSDNTFTAGGLAAVRSVYDSEHRVFSIMKRIPSGKEKYNELLLKEIEKYQNCGVLDPIYRILSHSSVDVSLGVGEAEQMALLDCDKPRSPTVIYRFNSGDAGIESFPEQSSPGLTVVSGESGIYRPR